MRLLPGLLHRNKQAGASLRECTCMNLVFISFCTGLKVDGTIFRTCVPSLWDVGDVSDLGRIPWVSRTYWRFIDFSKDTLGISMYTYAPEKRNGQPTLVAYLLAASLTGLCDSNQFSEVLQEMLLGCLANFETSFGVGWLSSPFRKESFSHIEQCFAVNLPDGQTATRDGSNLNCLLAAKQSEHWPVLRETWKVITCFLHKNVALRV